ncbi:microtubule-associated protein futsch [Drosophila innubila]|uniref:microtubule-associated protein futsch n=1 Tax=Drosophila innubila TaxID=198719 RepID=UPI00148B8FF2|nr:microtubule-associated protein futsch [Drosophila innubila]
MAASSATAECKEECRDKDDDALTTTLHTCANDPDFAVICAFMQKFAKDLGLALPNFKQLQEWLTNNDEVPELRDLHIKLLRKTRKTVHEKSWESALSKFCFGYSVQDAWEIERFGYRNSSLKVKLRILRELLESQFERNAKFRAHILTVNASSLRAQPIGRDRLGHAYWLTQDGDCNLRIYQEHLDEEIWQVVATNRDEFVNLIARLRGNEVVLPSKDIGEADEDTTSSSSSSNNAQLPPPEEQQQDQDDDSHEAKVPNLKIKLRTPDQQPEQQESEAKSKKVKPLLITQAKLGGSPAPAKKRPLEEVDSSPTALSAEEQQKKHRPTLLDTKRIKKPSRYESTKSEDDNEADSEDSELDEGEEEEEESLDGEEESLDSAAADEDENEQKFNEEDDNDDDDEVGEAIEEPTLIVRGQGAGRECQATPEEEQFLNTLVNDEDLDALVGEVIVEPLYYVHGSGNGVDCLVGNAKDESTTEESTSKPEPKATFFFGEPGCLKLSPIKQTPKQETKRSIFDSIGNVESEREAKPEKTNGESIKVEEMEKETTLLNGNESTEEETTKKSEDCNEDGESAQAVEEKAPEIDPKEEIPEARTEESNETKEISKEQMEKQENPAPKSEGNITQICNVKVIETSEESAKESIKTEAKKDEDKVENIAEKDENVQDVSQHQAENETIKEETDKLAEKTVEKSKKTVAIEEKSSKQQPETIVNEEKEVENTAKSVENEDICSTSKTTAIKSVINEKVDSNGAANGAATDRHIVNACSHKGETVETVQAANATPTTLPEPVTVNKLIDSVKKPLPSTSKIDDNRKPTSEASNEKNIKEKRNDASKSQATPENDGKKVILLPNRKRRLTDFTAPSPRHSTSESEVDAYAELQPEEEQQQLVDDNDDDLDVGGKRIKMRPKITNVEVRRKVEAQKTQIEETTSSSGEEDARSRRKIIAPKRHLEKPNPVRTKPTLAEIIEKKLKKTPEKPTEQLAESSAIEVTPPVVEKAEPVPFTPPKKSPITKPLKKNLLTQIRQEESDEDATPRKRTTSETVVASLPGPQPVGVESSQQRKRRSSEEGKESKEANVNEEPPAVSEKLKRNNDQVEEESVSIQQIEREKTPIEQKTSPLKRESLPVEEKMPPVKQEAEQIKPATPPPVKVEESRQVKESTPPPVKEEATPPAECPGRRSGRRGGAAVVHTELPQPKRTRGGIKDKPSVESKPQIQEDPLKSEEEHQDEEEEKEKPVNPVKPAAKTNSPIKEETKSEPTEPPKREESKGVSAKAAITPATPGVGRGRGPRKKREVDTTNIIDTNDSETPVRQSRRIAQQKIKEEAERRKLEEVALRTMKQQFKKKKKAEMEADPTVLEPSGESESVESASEAEETKKKIKKKCPGKDGWSSDSEEQVESEEEEEEPPHYDTDPGSPLFKSDHEFSPESELEDDSQVVPMKRARTLRKENADESEEADADEACQKCGKSDHPEWILLCDTPDCNKGYHCSCLSPVLFYIPEGDWHCPPCQQEQLIAALEQQLQHFDDMFARKQQEKLLAEEAERVAEAAAAARTASELEERSIQNARKKDDAEDGDDDDEDNDDEDDDDASSKANKRSKADKIKRRRGDGRSNRRAAKRGTRRRRGGKDDGSESGSSGTKSGKQSGGGGARSVSSSSSGSSSSSSFSDSDDEPIYKLRKRRQINVSYRLNEYDDLINSALKKEMDEVAGAGNLGRGKDISTIIEADKEKTRREEGEQPEDEGGEKEKTKQDKAEKLPRDSVDKSSNDDDSQEDEYDDDDQPIKASKKLKIKAAPPAKKKARKLTTLDVSSEEDHGSDEDFKTSSFSDEDSSQSASDDSDSSLEVYRRPGRGKKQRKAARRAARERRKDRKFVVEESDESEEEQKKRSKAGKSKKKRKEDSDYTETETDDDDDNGSELTENMDSADLCDDTTSESDDGGWHPSKRKKAAAKKASSAIARKSPKLKKPVTKKPKQLEYSDDDISESEEEDEEDDDDEQIGANGVPLSGKGSGKQPRSQPLKKTTNTSTTSSSSSAQSAGKGKGKGKGKSGGGGSSKKKKRPASSDDGGAGGGGGGGSDERTRTRGRRYAYIEDFDDDSSDGGIKPGVQRPDTPPEERQKFIQKQEEIKRMLAEKNAEGAKLAATPRLTPIKGATAAGALQEKRTPNKVGATPGAGDSLSTVPLSVIRQAKVLDIDYLQRKGEAVDDLDDVDESELDDAELPDDLPDDMEDAIARMVEEEEQFTAAAAARELPAPDDVLRTTPAKSKAPKHLPTTPEQLPSASGLQEPMRKRLPMPTMHPPLLRHQFPGHGSAGALPASLLPPPPGQQQQQQPPPGMHPMLQRHLAPPPQAMQLLQNALSAPLGQPLSRANYPPPPQQQQLPAMQRLPLGMSMPAAAAHLMQAAAAAAAVRPPPPQPDPKPRGRRKKVTPLRDQLQKQQTAAAVTAATSSSVGSDKSTPPGKAPPAQLFKPHEDAPVAVSQPSVITRMPIPSLLPPAHVRGAPPPPGGGMYPSSAELARFYGQPLPPSSALRPTYGAPPPLRGAPPTSSAGGAVGSVPNSRPPPYLHGPEHHGGPPPPPGSLAGVYGAGPPPARHAPPHLNPYRTPPIYGNPNYPPRVPQPGAPNMRPGAVDYAAGARGYPPYGYYPPPLTTPPAHASAPSSVIVSALPPPPVTPINHTVSALTRGKSPAPPAPAPVPVSVPVTSAAPVVNVNVAPPQQQQPPPTQPAPHTPANASASTTEMPKSSVITSKKLITLEAYSNTKSPLAVVGDSTADSPAAIAEEDSSSAHGNSSNAATGNSVGGGVGEFSGLVSYFSSQQDDYDT